MEIAIALMGLVGAILGLVTALVSRRREVVHRLQAYEGPRRPSGEGPPGGPGRPGALVLRSTLLGFAIGTFFGVADRCWLACALRAMWSATTVMVGLLGVAHIIDIRAA